MNKRDKRHPVIGLAGNPNTGKSTVFNALTGSKQEIGNWPGKTVEQKKGLLKHKNKSYTIVDLPGTYSLTAYSIEEIIARDFIVNEKPDVIINIVDASNLERNLYLTVQLMELGANVVIALNKVDLMESEGKSVDAQGLSSLLGVPVVPTIASKGIGIDNLINESISAMNHKPEHLRVNYGKDLEPKIAELTNHIEKHATKLADKYGARWLAVKLIEGDQDVIDKIKKADSDVYNQRFKHFIDNASTIYGDSADVEIADKRYGYINGIVKRVVKKTSLSKISASDRIDKFITNRWLGIPIFFIIMYALFQFVFVVGAPISDIISAFLEWFGQWTNTLLVSVHTPEWLISLIISGVIEGIGNIFVFIPNVALLFFAMAFLEDSGYMARAAFIMDRIMRKIGLQGKAFIPFVLAFGCNVPAIMAARTLSNEKDRTITILVNSIIPCTARIAVFVFIAGAFFQPDIAALIIWSLVVLSLVLAVFLSWLFRKTILKGPIAPFVMELPPYQLPTLKGMSIHTWERTKMFVYKAGTYILGGTLVIWLLATLPFGVEYGSPGSYIGMLGKAIAPILSPLGIDWIGTVALLFGFLAKEVVISSFGVLLGSTSEATLQSIIATHWTALQGYVFMVFTLLYIPCLATVAVIKKETNSWKWTVFAVGYTLVLAWIVSFVILNIGHLLGFS